MPDRSTRRRLVVTQSYEETRRTTWLEFFFDLVFIVVVFRLGQVLLDDSSMHGVLVFAGLMAVMWWLWLSFTYLGDLFDNDRPPSRLVQLLAMLGVLSLSAILEGGLGHPDRFALIYGLLLTMLALLYAAAGWIDTDIRVFCWWFSCGFLAGALLWFGSLLVPDPVRYLFWAAALVLNAAAAPLAYVRAPQVPAQQSHLPERFGFFTIVVLGDAILAVANGIATTGWNPGAVTIGLAGFVVAGGIWWLYFLLIFDREAANRVLRADRRRLLTSFLYSYGHLPLHTAIVVAGVGVELAARESAGQPQAAADPLLGGSQIALGVGFLLVSRGIGRRPTLPAVVAQVALVASGLLIALGGFPPRAMVILFAAGCVVLVVAVELTRLRRPVPAADADADGNRQGV
ncbi:low temperature requirement protein A [Plantactinospora sp. WMMB334]|uniref:low temperature requirement protein A n=1 Tax=Plantactinospora sp. WMMB334 TaxID=3404119 RepID=UPI003B960B3B